MVQLSVGRFNYSDIDVKITVGRYALMTAMDFITLVRIDLFLLIFTDVRFSQMIECRLVGNCNPRDTNEPLVQRHANIQSNVSIKFIKTPCIKVVLSLELNDFTYYTFKLGYLAYVADFLTASYFV